MPTVTNNSFVLDGVLKLNADTFLGAEPDVGHVRSVPTKPRAPAQRTASIKHIRVANQPGFVLHAYPYKETSLIVDVFSRDYGRVAVVAKGAKRPHSQLRNTLQTFQPLNMGWSGKAEIKTLISAEWVGGMLPLERSTLLCGFYLNELLVKFLIKDEPFPRLFDQYISTLNELAHSEPAPIVLRKFELSLLRESGLIGDFINCAETKQRVLGDLFYVLDPEHGVRLACESERMPRVLGQTLLDMHNGEYSDVTTQTQSKMLMRFLLAHHLHGMPLNTRQILIDLQKL